MMAPLEGASLAARRRALLERVQGSVLEIGGGTGASLPYYNRHARLIVSDPDPSMYRPLQEKSEEGRIQFDFLSSSAEAIPFGTDQFDWVVSTLVLCSVVNPVQALAEIVRVLKPSGGLLFLEHIRAEGSKKHVQDLLQPVWSLVGSGCHPNRPTVSIIRDSGFSIESLELFDPFSSFPGLARFALQFLTPFAHGVARKVGHR
jgi:ubiquinone/menaquinone biosynthesis C-methylase UbiE